MHNGRDDESSTGISTENSSLSQKIPISFPEVIKSEKVMPVLCTTLRLRTQYVSIVTVLVLSVSLNSLVSKGCIGELRERRKVSRRGRLGINQDVDPQVWYGKQGALFIPNHGRFKVRFPALYLSSVHGQHHRHHSLSVHKSSAIPELLTSRLFPTCRAHPFQPSQDGAGTRGGLLKGDAVMQ